MNQIDNIKFLKYKSEFRIGKEVWYLENYNDYESATHICEKPVKSIITSTKFDNFNNSFIVLNDGYPIVHLHSIQYDVFINEVDALEAYSNDLDSKISDLQDRLDDFTLEKNNINKRIEQLLNNE